MPYNKSFIDQASSVKMAGYWPRSLLTFLWTSTSSRSIKTQKENSANIQPSSPLAWSIIIHKTEKIKQNFTAQTNWKTYLKKYYAPELFVTSYGRFKNTG